MKNVPNLLKTFALAMIAAVPPALAVHLDIELKGLGQENLTAGFCLTEDPNIGCDLPPAFDALDLPPRTAPLDGRSGRPIFASEFGNGFGAGNEAFAHWTDNPGFNAIPGTLEARELIRYEILESLRYWTPTQGLWGRAPDGVRVRLFGGVLVRTDNSCGLVICPPISEFSFTTIDANGVGGENSLIIQNAGNNGGIHRHLDWYVEKDGVIGNGAPDGVYLVAVRLLSDKRGPSEKVYVAINLRLGEADFIASIRELMEAAPDTVVPTITRAIPDTVGENGGAVVSIVGTGFLPTPSVLFDGVPAVEVTYRNATRVDAVMPALPAGSKTIRVINPNLEEVSAVGILTVTTSDEPWVDVGPNTGGEAHGHLPFGLVTVTVEPDAFDTRGRLTVADSPRRGAELGERSDGGLVRGTGFIFEVNAPAGVQPVEPLTLTVQYTDQFLAQWEEPSLRLARFDPDSGLWRLLPTQLNTDSNTLTATTDHLSLFQVMATLTVPAGGEPIAFPVPFRPGSTQSELLVAPLPIGSQVLITDAWGARVRELMVGSDGGARWNGVNDDGTTVASGVYLIKVSGKSDRLKIVVQR